jgi:hypothetical protein
MYVASRGQYTLRASTPTGLASHIARFMRIRPNVRIPSAQQWLACNRTKTVKIAYSLAPLQTE